MKIFAKIAFCISFMTLTACATIELAPLPEGHPADSDAWVPREISSATLAEPEPVDTAPSRSDQWLKEPEADKPDHHGHDHGRPETNVEH